MTLSGGVRSTTTEVWKILLASKAGDLVAVQQLVSQCAELSYAQYNYTPPIHFAVREGHLELVKYLLQQGAHDPSYKTYPFLDKLQTIAIDRGYTAIAHELEQYVTDPALQQYKGDNGEIDYGRSDIQQEFETAVDKGDLDETASILKDHPEFARDNSYFWSEGILLMPSKEGNFKMIELLLSYGATFPAISKWPQYYYFERYDTAKYILENGMSANHMTWHHVTILHDMAQKGLLSKAELLLKHGADINAIEEEYQSTPLGIAVRWGQKNMVELLLNAGSDPNQSGSGWSRPLAWAQSKEYSSIERMLVNAGAV
jgi:ankyrin repeat protein